ncbi:hypothetical protein [Aeromonas veronii]|uniref:hypothetical protein n=1 Tax=Aeromonas veronii TaxID=654 RepID=UPI00244490CE|nr:hypothetical protein [Aeromonas veronii]
MLFKPSYHMTPVIFQRQMNNIFIQVMKSIFISTKTKTAALSCGFYFYSPNTFALNISPLAQLSPFSEKKAVNMNAKATGGHGIGSPCKPPSRVQRVRSAIRDDGAAAAGTGMCRLRRSVRPVGRDEGTREAGGLPGGEDLW